ncbi:hypothetical protein MKW94_018103, partial [Papaver nudicaule]|nr:hypothetical protein [Papaver nudicaule]
MGRSTRPSRDLENEIKMAKEETEHWKQLTCLILRQSEMENQLIECSEVEKRFKGFRETEILEKDDPNLTRICKRVKYTDIIMEIKQRGGKCQCVALNRKIENLKYGKERAEDEIEDLKTKCLELESQKDLVQMRCNQLIEQEKRNMESYHRDKCVNLNKEIEDLKNKCMESGIQGTVSSNRETVLGKELENCKIKCQGLSTELKQKEMELENLRVVNAGLDHEREDYRTKCIGMEEQIKGIIEEGIVMYAKETSAPERICHLEEVVKKTEANEREKFVQLNTENKKLEYGKKRAEDDRTESSAKRFKESETRLLRAEEENSTLRGLRKEVSCGKTSREMDGRVNVANLTRLIRTETRLNSTFTPSCKPSSLQVNSDGLHVS